MITGCPQGVRAERGRRGAREAARGGSAGRRCGRGTGLPGGLRAPALGARRHARQRALLHQVSAHHLYTRTPPSRVPYRDSCGFIHLPPVANSICS